MNLRRVAMISFHTCPLAALGEGKAGGMNVYVRELARNLGNVGFRVDLFTRCHTGHEAKVISLTKNVRVIHLDGGPRDESLGNFFSHLPVFLDELLRFSLTEGIDYQLVHSHYWLSGWVGERAAKAWNIPHVVACHTLAKVKSRAKPGQTDSPVRSQVEKEMLSKAALVIASSRHEKEAMVHLYGAPEATVEVVPCGVNLSLFKPMDPSETRKRLGLNGEKVLLCVGRIEPIKGLDLLLQSASKLELKGNLRVMVIGGEAGQRTEMKRLKALAQDLGIEKVLEFVGTVDHESLPIYYNAADICVVPSYYESSSLVALEALACGTPVVASRVGGLPNIVQHGLNGYLQFRRCPEPFADSLEVILSSKGLQKTMSREARKRAESMGWDKVAEETLRLYDRVANQPVL